MVGTYNSCDNSRIKNAGFSGLETSFFCSFAKNAKNQGILILQEIVSTY